MYQMEEVNFLVERVIYFLYHMNIVPVYVPHLSSRYYTFSRALDSFFAVGLNFEVKGNVQVLDSKQL